MAFKDFTVTAEAAHTRAALAAMDARLARIEAILTGAPAASAPATPEAAAPTEATRAAHVTCARVGCKGFGKDFKVTTDPTKGSAFHATWCAGPFAPVA
jgi:hypothetical protein